MPKKKSKKTGKKLSLLEFQGKTVNTSALPSAPGALPSGPGQGGRYGNNDRGRRGRGGFGDKGGIPTSRADESSAWRSQGRAPRRQNNSFSSNAFGDSRRDREPRGERRERQPQPESKYGDEKVGRDLFGSKKPAPRRNNFGSYDSPRAGRNTPDAGSDRVISREGFGTRKPQQRQSFGINRADPSRSSPSDSGGNWRSGTRAPRSDNSFGDRRATGSRDRNRRESAPSKNYKYDGTDEGFGAAIRAENNSESPSGPRLTYFGKSNGPKPVGSSRFSNLREEEPKMESRVEKPRAQGAAWNYSTSQQEKREAAAKKREEEKKVKQEAARKKREAAEKKRAEEEAKLKNKQERERLERERIEKEEKRVAHLKAIAEAVDNMCKGEQEIEKLTQEQITEVLPTREYKEGEAKILGEILAVTIHNKIIELGNLIELLPETNFDVVLLSTLQHLKTRLGSDAQLFNYVNQENVNVINLLLDQKDKEERMKKYDLDCLIPKDDLQEELDNIFNKKYSLEVLFEECKKLDVPNQFYPQIMAYIFDDFFQNEQDPNVYFNNQCIPEFVEYLTPTEDFIIKIVDSIIESWFKHSRKDDVLVPVFETLINNRSAHPSWLQEWSNESGSSEANQASLVSKCLKDTEEEHMFTTWIMEIETIFADLLAEEEDEEEGEEYENYY